MVKKKWSETVATEAINFQNDDLFKRLVELVKLWRAGEHTGSEAMKLGMSSVIQEVTGLNPIFEVMGIPIPNVAVQVPQLDHNNPVINDMRKMYVNNDDLHTVKKVLNGKVSGTINKGDGRVTGAFSKIGFKVYLSTGILEDTKFTDEEITATILHELGHVYSYFERLVDTVSINYAVEVATRKFLELETPNERMEILHEYDNVVGTKLEGKETISETTKGEVVFTHLVTETLKQRRNAEGDMIYSYRGFEFSSDQFAVRYGAGPYLISALDKLERKDFLNTSYRSWPLHVMIEILKVVGFVFTVGSAAMLKMYWNVFICILSLVAARPMNKIYDDPKERMERIEREMRAELKDKISKERKESILADLEYIKPIMAEVEDKRTFWEAVWAYVIPFGKESRKRMEFQQTVEKLSNNELYVASAVLS